VVTGVLEQWLPWVYRFALRLTGESHTAEDLTQETFLRAWTRRHQLRDPHATKVWLLQIAANLWRDQRRRARLPAAQTRHLPEDCRANSPNPEQIAAGQEELQRALAALQDLPPRQRQVLYLSACEDLSVQEIGQVLKIGPDAVKASLSLARKKLRQALWNSLGERPEIGERAP
jgi:RNA polymerase sigma-70 factor (ECF subfamily)